MPPSFPGMDPYLEQPGIWRQVHTALIVEIQQHLTPLLRPHYYVAIEQLAYLNLLPPENRVGIPDALVIESSATRAASQSIATATLAPEPIIAELPQPEEVKHRYLEIRDAKTQVVITTIEILSPSNKIGQGGREQYEQKRLKVLGSLANLVEIDLLRIGEPMPMKIARQDDYRIVISRSDYRPKADVYLFSIRQPIPTIPIPLRAGEAEPELPLNQLLHELYAKSGYDLMIDYAQPPVPPLSEVDMAWAAQLLTAQGQTPAV